MAKGQGAKGQAASASQTRNATASATSSVTRRIAHYMLLNDLYMIDCVQTGEDIIRASLRLNPAHPIFTGHFPGRPILPGACQLQMVQEVLSHVTAKNCRLQQARHVKFVTMIDPREHTTVDLTVHYGSHAAAAQPETSAPDAFRPDASAPGKWQVSATLAAGETIFLKFNGIFAAG